jgi:hypothetical protein
MFPELVRRWLNRRYWPHCWNSIRLGSRNLFLFQPRRQFPPWDENGAVLAKPRLSTD